MQKTSTLIALLLALLGGTVVGSAFWRPTTSPDNIKQAISDSLRASKVLTQSNAAEILLPLVHNDVEPATQASLTALSGATSGRLDAQTESINAVRCDVVDLQAQVDQLLQRMPPPPPKIVAGSVRRPKAVFVVLPGLDSTDPNASPSAKDMRNGILRHLELHPDIAGGVPPTDATPVTASKWIVRLPCKTDNFIRPKTLVDGEYIEVVFIAEGDTPTQTIDSLRQRALQYECVLVLGHEQSTHALNTYQQYYAPQSIPLVLLGPTNPQITRVDACRGEGNQLVLRMLPTDDTQVVGIREAILADERLSHEANAPLPEDILVVSDSTNSVYSNYIVDQITQDGVLGARMRGSIRVNLQDTLIPYQDRMARWGPRWIVFVGMSPTAKIFVNSLEREWRIADRMLAAASADPNAYPATELAAARALSQWLSRVHWVFSDGCASVDFADYLMTRTRPEWGPMTIISSMGPDPDKSSQFGDKFDYRELGSASLVLAQRLLADAGDAPTATTVIQAMSRIRGQVNALVLQSESQRKIYSNAGFGQDRWRQRSLPMAVQKVRFTPIGDNVAWTWHAYRFARNTGHPPVADPSAKFTHLNDAAELPPPLRP